MLDVCLTMCAVTKCLRQRNVEYSLPMNSYTIPKASIFPFARYRSICINYFWPCTFKTKSQSKLVVLIIVTLSHWDKLVTISQAANYQLCNQSPYELIHNTESMHFSICKVQVNLRKLFLAMYNQNKKLVNVSGTYNSL